MTGVISIIRRWNSGGAPKASASRYTIIAWFLVSTTVSAAAIGMLSTGTSDGRPEAMTKAPLERETSVVSLCA